MKIGFGKAVITPPVGFSLTGYFHDRRSTGIRDDLYATACVIEDKGSVFAIVSADLISISSDTVKKVRDIVSRSTGIPSANVFVHATHTHTGPLTEKPDKEVYKRGLYVEPCYLEILPFHIAGSIKAAHSNRKESSVGFASDKVPRLAFNRRYLLKDGRIITNPWDKTDDIVGSAGPVDDSLGIIKVTDGKTGEITGLIINFACHPDTLGDNMISGDWPGMLRNKLKKQFPCAEVLVLNGPSGDINHINPADPGRRGLQVPDHIAETLKKKTVRLLNSAEFDSLSGLRVYNKKFSLPVTEISHGELKSAKEILKKKGLPKDSLQYMISDAQVRAALERKKGNKNISAEINGFSFGKDLLVLGMPGEIFTDISVQIKKLSPFRHTLIAQNSNAALGYVPSEEAFLQNERNRAIKPEYGTKSLAEAIGIDCSYETTPFACKVSRNAEKSILQVVKELLK